MLRSSDHHLLETALRTHTLRTSEALNGIIPKRQIKVKAPALKNRDRMVSALLKILETAKKVEKKRWMEKIDDLEKFLASRGLASDFIQRRNVRSRQNHGEAAFISEESNRMCRSKLSQNLSFFHCQNITKTDEV